MSFLKGGIAKIHVISYINIRSVISWVAFAVVGKKVAVTACKSHDGLNIFVVSLTTQKKFHM